MAATAQASSNDVQHVPMYLYMVLIASSSRVGKCHVRWHLPDGCTRNSILSLPVYQVRNAAGEPNSMARRAGLIARINSRAIDLEGGISSPEGVCHQQTCTCRSHIRVASTCRRPRFNARLDRKPREYSPGQGLLQRFAHTHLGRSHIMSSQPIMKSSNVAQHRRGCEGRERTGRDERKGGRSPPWNFGTF